MVMIKVGKNGEKLWQELKIRPKTELLYQKMQRPAQVFEKFDLKIATIFLDEGKEVKVQSKYEVLKAMRS